MGYLLEQQIMAGRVLGGPPPFVIDLGGSDVAMPEEVLHFSYVDVPVQKKCGCGGTERVGGVDAYFLDQNEGERGDNFQGLLSGCTPIWPRQPRS